MVKQAALIADSEDDLFAPIFSEFAIPAQLQKFDVKVSEERIRKLGEDVFLRWLHYRLKRRDVPVRKSPVPVACQELERVEEYAPGRTVETTFFPDHPYAEDYVHGENDIEYQRAAHTAKIQTLIAQRDCSTCHVAKACLDISVIHTIQNDVSGVWGGHNEQTRRLILNRFNKLRRAYDSTKTNDMSEETREKYRAIASALTFTD